MLHLHGSVTIPGCRYELARIFDATSHLERLDIQGKGFLSFDSCFLVFHLQKEVSP